MNVVAYCSISTDSQTGEDQLGIETQKQNIIKYCDENDLSISDWYIDEGKSRAKESRPKLDLLLFGDIQNPPIEAVVVYRSDHIARNIKLYYYYMMLLEKKGIQLISATEPIVNDETGLGEVYKSLMLFVVQQERENLTKRTSAGRRIKANSGGYAGGRPPLGYIVKDGMLIIEPNEAETVRIIYTMRADRYTMKQIAVKLNELGRLTKLGRPFAHSTVQTILNNRKTYEGFYKYGDGEWVEGSHERILYNED